MVFGDFPFPLRVAGTSLLSIVAVATAIVSSPAAFAQTTAVPADASAQQRSVGAIKAITDRGITLSSDSGD